VVAEAVGLRLVAQVELVVVELVKTAHQIVAHLVLQILVEVEVGLLMVLTQAVLVALAL
jgi:hypothetical protein